MTTKNTPDWRIVAAGEITAAEIGHTIRFLIVDEKTNIERVTTAELRQISHDGSRTFLEYGEMAACQAEFQHNHPVMVDPPIDYFPTETGLLRYVSDGEDEL